MLFPTLEFGLFFLIVLLTSWLLSRNPGRRKIFLLLASYFFYGYWDWRFMLLLAGSSTVNYVGGRLLGLAFDTRERKWIVGVTVSINLLFLGFFKYYEFFLESLSDLLIATGLERDMPFMEVVLPVGISFFTFQGISYVVDVYRRQIEPTNSPLDLFLYISFFPQLVAGPIIRAANFIPQLQKPPRIDRVMIGFGVVLILLGLFKKMVIANYLAGEIVDVAFIAPSSYGGADLMLAIYAYAVQIYCDFSGYSDIAIGVAALLGYRFSKNFDQPYRAASLREFWRRWHISLSTWLRDYLYKPLGGSYYGQLVTYRNLLITMLLGGIWHGAAITFIIWGVIHAAALVGERILNRTMSALAILIVRLTKGTQVVKNRSQNRLVPLHIKAGKIFLTFHIVCLTWIFFRSENLDYALQYLDGLKNWNVSVELASPFIVAMVFLSLSAHFWPADLPEKAGKMMAKAGALSLGIFLGLGLFLIYAVAPEEIAPFIYFQF
jgi:D-alanyl-lipoteichoic acid acyltransferase DltB (MBOAT superfamily)